MIPEMECETTGGRIQRRTNQDRPTLFHRRRTQATDLSEPDAIVVLESRNGVIGTPCWLP
jgi:hypothetical protein